MIAHSMRLLYLSMHCHTEIYGLHSCTMQLHAALNFTSGTYVGRDCK